VLMCHVRKRTRQALSRPASELAEQRACAVPTFRWRSRSSDHPGTGS